MPVDPEASRSLDERLMAAGVGATDRIIVIHVSAGNPFRRWPLEAFTTLVTMLVLRDARRRVVVTSGPSEHHAASRVVEQASAMLEPSETSRISTCGELTLGELRALMDRAALFIGGDSGPLHVAATSAVPIVGLYGPTLPVRSQPWRSSEILAEAVGVEGLPCRPCDQRRCTPGDFRCLTTLRPEHVIEAAERVLARATGLTKVTKP
jgi:ADP-heptose:LPS heptosyltransferase